MPDLYLILMSSDNGEREAVVLTDTPDEEIDIPTGMSIDATYHLDVVSGEKSISTLPLSRLLIRE